MINSPRNRILSTRFAKGRRAKAQCVVCGLVVPYQSLVRDWRGVWVCSDCNDERPADIITYVDAQQLRHPQPMKETFDPPEQLPLPLWD